MVLLHNLLHIPAHVRGPAEAQHGRPHREEGRDGEGFVSFLLRNVPQATDLPPGVLFINQLK